MSTANNKPYEVTQDGDVIRVTILDESRLVRCSPEELFASLLGSHGYVSHESGEEGAYVLEVRSCRPDDALCLVIETVTAAFAPRFRSTAWKD